MIMIATTCRGRGRYASLAVSLLILLARATSSEVVAIDQFVDGSEANAENGQLELHRKRNLSAKAGEKTDPRVHHGPRHSKTEKEAAYYGIESELISSASTYATSGAGGGKSGKVATVPVTTQSTSPILVGVTPGSLTNTTSDLANATSQDLGEVDVVTFTSESVTAEISSTTSIGKAGKKEWSGITASDTYTPYTTTTNTDGGESTIKGGDTAAKSGKAVYGGYDVVSFDSDTSYEEGDPVSKAYKVAITSSIKPKADKEPLTHYFVKQSSSLHSEIEGTIDVNMGGKSGKAADSISNVDGSMSFGFLLSGKASKPGGGGGSTGGMSYGTNPDIMVPIPPVEFGSSAPVSTPLLTLPPTALAGSLPPGTTAPPVVGLRSGTDAKYWPHEAMDGSGKCEFSANYPLEYAQEQLREVYLFDTLEECCAMYEAFCLPTFPTYSPTGDVKMEGQGSILSTQGEHVVALEPFGVKLFANQAEPSFNEETVLRVTKEHLTHSFRTHGYEVVTMKLVSLEHERHLIAEETPAVAYSATTLRWLEQHPVFVVVMGGAIEFASDAKIPSEEEKKTIVEGSFSSERLAYYVELLNEADVDVANAELDPMLLQDAANEERATNGFDWRNLAIGMSSAFVGIGLIAAGSRQVYKRRQLSIDDLDLEKGICEDYTIRLQYTNDELEATVDETATRDQLSVPSLVQGIEDEVNYQATPNGTRSYSSYEQSDSKGKSSMISPLESPHGTNKEVTKRYISVFTVKKDCGGKTLDQIDLRALAIAYLSRMLKKFPNTYLLPNDKTSSLPAIIHIRDIPDDLEVLHQYIGNARVDEKSGKVLFNLRVESDEPVSKMKSSTSSSSGSGSSSRRVRFNASPAADEDTSKKLQDSPKSPESMEDVDL